ncbi:putative ribosomal protein S6 kinase alpha-2 [Parelaphostrongylus tenuis]|uniref:Ribosomal protein S6 kinase n=1 Tax=Parelaphostrongylus tenuis TaxID=148309 RepID=A0AAD5MD45_PARTN|nr:putative ribosomal protein S6 kinase alpha-2 [Parelaphostrongylus tenuis]
MASELPSEEKVSMENFALLRVLGKGAYGKVFLVRKVGGRDHGQIYAMKVLRKIRVLSKPKSVEHTMAERQVLERLRGVPFFVNLYYAFQTDTKLHIVMEYVRGGELFTHLCSHGSFDVQSARFIIAELIVAIDSLHKRRVIYRDLKLENILLDEEGHVKLTDFGLSKLLVSEELERANSYCGTIEYMSPEVINRPEGGYSDIVDWWSMGVISFELMTGCSPFTVDGGGNSSKEIAKRILNKKVPFPRNMDPLARDFIGSLLEKNVEKRLGYNGVEEIKNHKFLQGIDWNMVANRQLKPFIVPNVTHELDVQNFAKEFTNQQPLYSPAESPVNGNTLFRGYSYISPSVIFSNNNVIGEELMQEDIQALLVNSSFFGKYKLDTTEKGYLGRGSFSVVRRCERIEDGAVFAVKIVSQRFATQAQRESRILEIVKGHVNIVRLFDVHSDPLHYYIVMELLTGQELLARLRKFEKFTEAEAANIMRQLVSAVGYLHSKRIVHRDLKPENILFESDDPNAQLRLVDFGFARLLPACVEQQMKSVYRKMTPCFTLQYAAPEVLDLGDTLPEYNEQCDLWSLGVVLFTMLSGQVPFHARSKTESATEIMERIRKAQFSFDGEAWKAVSVDAKQLINGLLTVDPKKRLSMQELSHHVWLNSAASLETPLHTPNVLPTFAGETFNETLQAFLTANRDGFYLMDVDAAPLMKRRGLKRQSAEKEENDKASKRAVAFDPVPEEHVMVETSRPTSLKMTSPDLMSFRVPPAGTIRETRGSDSS